MFLEKFEHSCPDEVKLFFNSDRPKENQQKEEVLSVEDDVKVGDEKQEDGGGREGFQPHGLAEKMIEAVNRKENQKIQWPQADSTSNKEEKGIEIANFSFFFQGQPSEQEG